MRPTGSGKQVCNFERCFLGRGSKASADALFHPGQKDAVAEELATPRQILPSSTTRMVPSSAPLILAAPLNRPQLTVMAKSTSISKTNPPSWSSTQRP